MKPEKRSKNLLGVARSKAKMYEYGIPEESHISIAKDPSRLFSLAIGLIGDLAAKSNASIVDNGDISDLKTNLQFSAHFFDAYLNSRLDEKLRPYLLLLGSASYYLCDLPGSALVLANQINKDDLNLEGQGLEILLLWLLQGDWSMPFKNSQGGYAQYIDEISQALAHFYSTGKGKEILIKHTSELRRVAYYSGTPRQLLFSDAIYALSSKRVENSAWQSLPLYSGLTTEQWQASLEKGTFIHELWPAQHLLGKHGVFIGKSAVVQMPTSAGKTKATEIIIRSAFLSRRTMLAVIVAPFRALCHEIRNSLIGAFQGEFVSVDELSDVLQMDFKLFELLERKQILVATPEKLIYTLRHSPELAERIGLLIYDEGHQFDSGTRGITYELLLTSLKQMLPAEALTILISAVISNASSVAEWLIGNESEVILGTGLTPTYRTVAFSSWLDLQGRVIPTGWMKFVNPDNPDDYEFFVPRVIERQKLKGRKEPFPTKASNDRGKEVALYLGLKLSSSGSVAIFCGRKDTAAGMCEKLIEAYERGLSLVKPIDISDKEEVYRLQFLYASNLGDDATVTSSAKLGIFAHHGNTPHGIRLSVEYAMKEGLIKLVICTSTLAQGVNLPIRYLILTSVYQGTERIRVRDFHNLIGRAGRSGMHTEGSILFADSDVYDKRNFPKERWRWEEVKELLEPRNSEPCASTLLSIFEPLHNDKKTHSIKMQPLEFVKAYVNSNDAVQDLCKMIAFEYENKGFTLKTLEGQVLWKMNILSSVESYLMAHWEDFHSEAPKDITVLAKETLAYFLANEEEKRQLVELFVLLAQYISQNVPDASRRKIFGKTLYGVRTAISIESWLSENIDQLLKANNYQELLDLLWPLISKNIQNTTFQKFESLDILKMITDGWLRGQPFYELFQISLNQDARLIAGTQRRKIKLDHIIDVCENGLAYDGTLILGAVAEIIKLIQQSDAGSLIDNLHDLQKRLQYGLPDTISVLIYELGFADRVVSTALRTIVLGAKSRKDVKNQLRIRKVAVQTILNKYPSYFHYVFNTLLQEQ